MTSATTTVRHGTQMLVTLAVLLAFASISTDLFLPALPTMSRALNASEGSLQFTISAYLLGFGFGQLFWGPISDRFGRRIPVAVGVAIFVIGSAGCALSTDVWQIVGWRVVQALGASAGVALARAMVRDLYDRNHAARVLSGLMTVMAVAPLLGPSVGAQILAAFSWQAIFWFLVVIGAATLAAILALPETLASGAREASPIWHALGDYPPLLRNRLLIGYAAAIGFYYCGIFANIAGGAFAFISYHHLSPQQYGLVFASGVVGVMAANMVNVRLVTRIGSDRLLIIGASGAALCGLGLAIVTMTDFGGVWGLLAGQLLFATANGLILANAVAGGLSSVHHKAGTASALLGAIQYGSGMVGSALVGLLANGTPAPMGWVMGFAGLGCLASVLFTRAARRSRRVVDPGSP
ncbi:MAG TPA: multidrug effflux MFS transporter [Kaistia sp.]|nr:multidrug effflux MFS transporter [Kaistia sp.]